MGAGSARCRSAPPAVRRTRRKTATATARTAAASPPRQLECRKVRHAAPGARLSCDGWGSTAAVLGGPRLGRRAGGGAAPGASSSQHVRSGPLSQFVNDAVAALVDAGVTVVTSRATPPPTRARKPCERARRHRRRRQQRHRRPRRVRRRGPCVDAVCAGAARAIRLLQRNLRQPEHGHRVHVGTSMACPAVSGAAAVFAARRCAAPPAPTWRRPRRAPRRCGARCSPRGCGRGYQTPDGKSDGVAQRGRPVRQCNGRGLRGAQAGGVWSEHPCQARRQARARPDAPSAAAAYPPPPPAAAETGTAAAAAAGRRRQARRLHGRRRRARRRRNRRQARPPAARPPPPRPPPPSPPPPPRPSAASAAAAAAEAAAAATAAA
jgi:hypothetical protein